VIFGYPDRPCVEAGGDLRIFISRDGGDYTESFIPIPASQPPGVYIAALDGGEAADARSARLLYVVRPRRAQARLLVVLPLFTYHAYNVAEFDGTQGNGEGDCLYSGAKWVSLHRPGGGTGGHPWDEVNADAYDRTSPRQTFAHWDAPGIAWMNANGFAHDCCTDLELHDGCVDIGEYRALVSFGHHEYWTAQMRDRVEAFVASGGNAAFFGGNTCWFELQYDEARHAISRVGRWNANPEWRFTGVSYACGGGKWIGERPPSGFCVRDAHHWVFSGTHLHENEEFGSRARLIGYECDGAPAQSDLELLAEASLAHWNVQDGSGEVSPRACASMGVRRHGEGCLFTASTVDWARVLHARDARVARITHNVLQRFGS
jgi:hypothetical protein